MKRETLIFFIFCFASTSVFCQTLFEKKLFEKEAMELAYITNCLSKNKRVDSLIEWKFFSENDTIVSFNYKRSRLVFFGLHNDSSGKFLKLIDYYHRSYEQMIYFNNFLSENKISNQTTFKTWMSKDKLSIYFCMINPNSITIWILSNGNKVYNIHSNLVQMKTKQNN